MADRPEECSQCRKPIAAVYKEIVSDLVTCTEMCADCPVLQARLYGTVSIASGKQTPGAEAGVCCGRCGTTLLSVRTGGLVGCSECYTVFDEVLVHELVSQGKVPNRMRKMQENSKKQFLHAGKTPDKAVELSSTSRIVSLNEALKEALKKENYEQAAWLRDQIKALTEKGEHEGTG